MPWETAYDRTEVLSRAMHVFWAHGYEATSMADLVTATGINRGSIYAAFDGKRSLFIEVLRHYDQIHRHGHLSHIAQSYPPRQAIIAAFEGAARNTGCGDTPGGCLMVNTVLELSPHDAEIRQLTDDCLGEVEAFFFSMIKAAKREGTIRSSLPSRARAKALLGLFLGLRVLTRGTAHKSSFDAITSQADSMLD
ncbi:MAG: TetR/AcrR family transcriptional regulator [Rhizobiales bacterium]|nr:TetR/AcrR family transcriptional regulator [Hyphomicrobiales bacterium]